MRMQLRKVTGVGDQMLRKLRSFEVHADVHGLTVPNQCHSVDRVSQLQAVIAHNAEEQAEVALYAKALGITHVRARSWPGPPLPVLVLDVSSLRYLS